MMPTDGSDTGDSDATGADGALAGSWRRSRDPSRYGKLVSTIEAEIVPRLLLLRRSGGALEACPGPSPEAIDEGDVEELTRLLIEHGPEVASAFVAVVRERGVPYEHICLTLLAPAAHRLADRWEHQYLGYSELTLGLKGLRAVLLDVSRAISCERHVSRGD